MNYHAEAFVVDTDSPLQSMLTWEDRYEGVFAVACIGSRRVAGISGPWSGKYALTWWDRPMPARQLELFDSLDEARAHVEAWALRMEVGLSSAPPARRSRRRPPPGLLTRIITLLGTPIWPRPANDAVLDHLRRLQTDDDTALANLHFGAYDEARARS
ncbi:hypothetical protein [Dokdonella sp.]|uniref:hypothetical protein n=1 Tax=Dokdonella sp. TaxID=2291710 RepID=UPI0031C28ED9|nr:hypothetical protein [Dokdonella sp.]